MGLDGKSLSTAALTDVVYWSTLLAAADVGWFYTQGCCPDVGWFYMQGCGPNLIFWASALGVKVVFV